MTQEILLSSSQLVVNRYESDEEPASSQTSTKEKLKRGKNRIYFLDQTFFSENEAKDSLETTWSNPKKSKTIEGLKVFYRCNLATARGKQCAAGVYLLYHLNKELVEVVSVFRTNCK